MKQASLEERQQRDGKNGYCSEEMSVGCICGNLSMCSQPEMRGREVERNQRFNWEPRRSKQSSATGNQSAMAKWSNRRAGRQWWDQAEVSNTTPAMHKELWEATQWPEASSAWRATSSRQLLTANEGGNALHWNISGEKKQVFVWLSKELSVKMGLSLAVISLRFIGLHSITSKLDFNEESEKNPSISLQAAIPRLCADRVKEARRWENDDGSALEWGFDGGTLRSNVQDWRRIAAIPQDGRG